MILLLITSVNGEVNIVNLIYIALWSVMFSTFAFYFMRYNSRKFYDENVEWGAFDDELKALNE